MPLALSESYLSDEGMAYSRLRVRASYSTIVSVNVLKRERVARLCEYRHHLFTIMTLSVTDHVQLIRRKDH